MLRVAPHHPYTSGKAIRLARFQRTEHLMLDVVMLALGLAFFALAVGYTYACERL